MKAFEIKDEVDLRDFQMLHPALIIVIGHIALFCKEHQLPLTLTSLMDDAKGRVSRSHSDGRAFDMSVRGIPEDKLNELKAAINHCCGHLGAISARDMKQRLIVDHAVSGSARHLHIQVKP